MATTVVRFGFRGRRLVTLRSKSDSFTLAPHSGEMDPVAKILLHALLEATEAVEPGSSAKALEVLTSEEVFDSAMAACGGPEHEMRAAMAEMAAEVAAVTLRPAND